MTAPQATANSSSRRSSPSGGSKAKRQKQGSVAAPAVQQLAQIDTSALQNLVGGETVFYGKSASNTAGGAGPRDVKTVPPHTCPTQLPVAACVCPAAAAAAAGPRGRVVASVRPAVGLALLHLHGEDRCLEHEANVVLQGVKYVLRSDVVFAPPEAA